LIRIATAPVSWGIWEMTIDRPDLIGPELYLETIVDMGYTATETGPPGYFAPNGAAAVEKAARYGVELIATFLPLRLDDAEGFEEDLQPLDKVVEVLEATGGGILLLADMETADRARAAGSDERRRATGWDSETFDRAAERLMRAADLVRSRGLDVALHHHAATHIESEEEIEEMLARTPGLGLCIDTGHAVVGGADPLALAGRHLDRIRHLHLKDVDGAVFARLQAGELDMDEAWPEGIFCEFGAGVVPLREFLALPEIRALDVRAVIEQDRVAVTVADMPVVRAADERNRTRVEDWLR
jgi:inosose dehydratase